MLQLDRWVTIAKGCVAILDTLSPHLGEGWLVSSSFGHVRLDPRLPLAPHKLHAMSCNDLGALPGVFDVRPGTFKYKYNRRVHADDAHDISILLRASSSPADYPLLGLSLVT